MARIRSIKPEFPQSESIGKLTRESRLLFLQLFTLVDDEGRTRAASRMLASLLYPYDDDARMLIDGWLGELSENRMITIYEIDGSTYLEINNWLKHQKIDHPTKSKIPSPESDFAKIREFSRSLAPDLDRIGRDRSSTDASHLSSVEPSAAPDPLPEKLKISRKADPAVLEMIVEVGLMWNELAGRFGLPKVEQVTPARRSSLLARSRELTASHDFTDPLEGFRVLFEKVSASRFLTGQSPPRKDGGPPFRASFDWIIKQSNFQKIMEGNYENSNRPQTLSRVQPLR